MARWPVFTHTTADQHLFCGDTGKWLVSDTADMSAGNHTGWICSTSPSPSPLGLQWWAVSVGTKWALGPAVTLATPTWITGSPPNDWIFHDARVESYNEESHEHKLIFNNLARTSLHLRLDHHQFLDWDVLPRRRAAMLAPRTVVTALMILTSTAPTTSVLVNDRSSAIDGENTESVPLIVASSVVAPIIPAEPNPG